VVTHVSGAFSFYQEFKSNRIMESFKNILPRSTYVYRQGRRMELDVHEIVVGDIVEMKIGDLVPADVRILECQDFKVDNSSLTGESEPCKRYFSFYTIISIIGKKTLKSIYKRSPEFTHENPMETRNMAFFSTNAVGGFAKAVVVKVGGNTLMGKNILIINHSLNENDA
jgi:sodium/potassium-transporting ATPase subunit alpha